MNSRVASQATKRVTGGCVVWRVWRVWHWPASTRPRMLSRSAGPACETPGVTTTGGLHWAFVRTDGPRPLHPPLRKYSVTDLLARRGLVSFTCRWTNETQYIFVEALAHFVHCSLQAIVSQTNIGCLAKYPMFCTFQLTPAPMWWNLSQIPPHGEGHIGVAHQVGATSGGCRIGVPHRGATSGKNRCY